MRPSIGEQHRSCNKVRATWLHLKNPSALAVLEASSILVRILVDSHLSHNFACPFGSFGASLHQHANHGPAEAVHIGNLVVGELFQMPPHLSRKHRRVAQALFKESRAPIGQFAFAATLDNTGLCGLWLRVCRSGLLNLV